MNDGLECQSQHCAMPRRIWRLIAIFALAAGCTQPRGSGLSPAAFRAAVSGTEWELHELDGAVAPLGAGDRRATIRFEADTARVAGFAGCNRYFGTYMLDSGALRFSRVGMTKMACSQGMALEQQLAAALEATRRYQVADRELTLFDDVRPVARFVHPAR
jgi:heat shock protein HslJ